MYIVHCIFCICKYVQIPWARSDRESRDLEGSTENRGLHNLPVFTRYGNHVQKCIVHEHCTCCSPWVIDKGSLTTIEVLRTLHGGGGGEVLDLHALYWCTIRTHPHVHVYCKCAKLSGYTYIIIIYHGIPLPTPNPVWWCIVVQHVLILIVHVHVHVVCFHFLQVVRLYQKLWGSSPDLGLQFSTTNQKLYVWGVQTVERYTYVNVSCMYCKVRYVCLEKIFGFPSLLSCLFTPRNCCQC